MSFKQSLCVIALAVFACAGVHAAEKPAPVSLYVPMPETTDGFRSPDWQDRMDARTDLIKAFAGKASFAIVPDATSADVTITVSRAVEESSETQQSYRLTREHTRRNVITAHLTAGSFDADVIAGRERFMFWREATDQLVRKISVWVGQNYETLLARRTSRQSP